MLRYASDAVRCRERGIDGAKFANFAKSAADTVRCRERGRRQKRPWVGFAIRRRRGSVPRAKSAPKATLGRFCDPAAAGFGAERGAGAKSELSSVLRSGGGRVRCRERGPLRPERLSHFEKNRAARSSSAATRFCAESEVGAKSELSSFLRSGADAVGCREPSRRQKRRCVGFAIRRRRGSVPRGEPAPKANLVRFCDPAAAGFGAESEVL